MCGIFGYSGKEEAVPLVLSGLEKLEYRGYDSAGIAAIHERELVFCKELGKVSKLKNQLEHHSWSSRIAIGHTRWATHGEPSLENAHPHFDEGLLCALVHNGIIENYLFLKDFLIKQGVKFQSLTDSEVIVQLIGFFYKGNFLNSVRQAISVLKGSFAVAVIHRYHPDELICVAKNSPLLVGLSDDGIFISSDAHSLTTYTSKVMSLQERDCAFIHRHSVKIFNSDFVVVNKEIRHISGEAKEQSKGEFQHYMLKEIFEQPSAIQNLLSCYLVQIKDDYVFSDKFLKNITFETIEHIYIIACGSSYHAGLVASYFLEDWSGIHVTVETSSEFRYRNRRLSSSSIAIVISQSGETADTISAVEELRKKNVSSIIGIVNVEDSSLTRIVDESLLIHAGFEISVASTKTFTNQLVLLLLIGLKCAQEKNFLSDIIKRNFLSELISVSSSMQGFLENNEHIQKIAEKYFCYEHFFFIGRRYMYPIALEGALKLKEIAYVDANAYPAGEMKHGPLALINPSIPTLALCTDTVVYDKMLSNLMEIKARKGKILVIAYEESYELQSLADHCIVIPKISNELAPLLTTSALQLLSYYIALLRKKDIDCPRNLAKSVTVE